MIGQLLCTTLIIFCISLPLHAQEQENVPEQQIKTGPILELLERQEKRQQLFNNNLRDIRQNLRQLNLNILSWQTATQNNVAGDPSKCPFFKHHDNKYLFFTVIALAIYGTYDIIWNKLFGLIEKKKGKNKE